MRKKVIMQFMSLFICLTLLIPTLQVSAQTNENQTLLNNSWSLSQNDLYTDYERYVANEDKVEFDYMDIVYGNRWGTIGNTAPSFEGVTYKIKDDVKDTFGTVGNALYELQLGEEIVDNKVFDIAGKDKLKLGAFLSESSVESYLGMDTKPGDIFYDSSTNLAVKIANKDLLFTEGGVEYAELVQPQLHEIFDDLVIPDQVVELNQQNIIYENEDIMTSRLPQSYLSSNTDLSNYLLASLTDIEDLGLLANAGDYVRHHLQNPIVEYEFDETFTTAYANTGEEYSVQVSGYLGIDSLNIESKYSANDGFKLIASTGEAMALEVVMTASVKKDLTIPIYGFQVDVADIGEVKGGLFLVIGIDGQVQVVTVVSQYTKMRMGVKGNTTFYIPSSIKKVKETDSDFNVDVNVSGHMNAYAKVGPEVKLEVMGIDCVGINLYVGAGLESELDNSLLTLKVYAMAQSTLSLLGDKYKLVNVKEYLYDSTQVDTGGYTYKFLETCAYEDVVWLQIISEKTGDDDASDIVVEIRYYDPITGIEQIEEGTTNEQGIIKYADNGWDIKKTDEISIYTIDTVNFSEILGEEIARLEEEPSEENLEAIENLRQVMEEMIVHPTYPFEDIVITYADYFNDTIVGSVIPRATKNWFTGESYYHAYEGDVQFIVYEDEVEVASPAPVGVYQESSKPSVNQKGQMEDPEHVYHMNDFEQSFDFKPGQRVVAKLVDDGFRFTSDIVESDVDFISNRTLIEFPTYQRDENGLIVEGQDVYEALTITNLRGDKTFNQEAKMDNDYMKYEMLSFIYDPISGKRLKPADLAHSETHTVMAKEHSEGLTIVEAGFITEFQWALSKGLALSNVDISNSLDISLPGQDSTHVKDGLAENLEDYIKDPIYTYRYESNVPYSDEGTRWENGIEWIRRRSSVTINYEGVDHVFSPMYDYNEGGNGRFMAAVPNNYVEAELIERIYSHINPIPVAIFNPADDIMNIAQIPSWSRESVVNMVSNGYMDLEQNQVPTGENLTRGEFASFLSRAFSLEVPSGDSSFKDISLDYTYANEVEAAFKAGLIKGVGDGSFNPNGNVTRQEAAVMIMRGLNLKGVKTSTTTDLSSIFKDAKNISSWALDAVAFVYGQGLIKGNDKGNFNPKGNITFDEMAIIMDRMMQ